MADQEHELTLDAPPMAAAEDDFPRIGPSPVKMRLVITIVVSLVAAVLGWLTWIDFAYWARASSEPNDLGHLSQRWNAGERELSGVESNSFVRVTGMRSAFESKNEAGTNFFVSPQFSIVVRTDKPFPVKEATEFWHIQLVPGTDGFTAEKRTGRVSLTTGTQFAGEGRLIRADDTPEWTRAPAKVFASRLGVDTSQLWFFIDGDRPDAYGHVAVLWGASGLAVVASLAFLLLAWRRDRAEASA